MIPTDLAACVLETWSLKIGDPTVIAWATVACYLVAGVLAALVSCRQGGRQRIFWLGLTAVLFALAINKQLDLQSALTAAGRCIARAQGWYSERRAFQIKLIFSIIGVSLSAGVLLTWMMRRELGSIWLALIGVVFLFAFIAVRAASFHHFDQFIGYRINNIRMNLILELGGIVMITVNALCLLLRKPKNKETALS